nr:hypothetical protein [Oscillochloris trichoides]
MESDFTLVDVRGDVVKFQYYDMTFVVYVVENGRKATLPKQVWFSDSDVFAHLARKAKRAWSEAQMQLLNEGDNGS